MIKENIYETINNPKYINCNPFFNDLEYIRPVTYEYLEQLRKENLDYYKNFSGNNNIELAAKKCPVISSSQRNMEIFKYGNFKQTEEIQNKSADDLRPIHENLKINGPKAWVKVRNKKDGKEFYMTWSKNASMWSYPITTTTDNGPELQYVQVGIYTQSTNFLGFYDYNLSSKVTIPTLAAALLIGALTAYSLIDGAAVVISTLLIKLASFAVQIGIEAASFTIPTALISITIGVIVGVIVFIGLMSLWNWINRKYTLVIKIYNNDTKRSLKILDHYFDNGIVPGGLNKDQLKDLYIPKRFEKGKSPPMPNGNSDIEALEDPCYFVTIIVENDNTFFEGCGFSIKIKIDNDENVSTDEGFMYALDVPRFKDNKHAAKNGLENSKDYFDKANWSETPLNFNLNVTKENVPVTVTMNALNSADNNYYYTRINFNN